jgi:hypothetical protein
MGTPDGTDWRLQGQESYLAGAKLRFGPYRRHPRNPSWDHDHCEFCGAKFMVEEGPDVLHEGYHTVDEYRWTCSTCFEDFRGRFGWDLINASGDV